MKAHLSSYESCDNAFKDRSRRQKNLLQLCVLHSFQAEQLLKKILVKDKARKREAPHIFAFSFLNNKPKKQLYMNKIVEY